MAMAPRTAARPELLIERLTATTATNAAIKPPRASVTWPL